MRRRFGKNKPENSLFLNELFSIHKLSRLVRKIETR